jgi:MFS family permease
MVTFKLDGLWRHTDFVRLWTGSTISTFGSIIGNLAMQFTAVLWLHAGPVQLAILAASQIVPGFLASTVAGVWADRIRRRPIMIGADIGRFFLLATIPAAAVFDLLTFAQLCLVALGTSALGVFFSVSTEAYLPTVVSRSALVEANSKLSAAASVAEFGSFSLAGWLVQLIKGPGAIFIDALSFLGSAICIWRIRTPEPAPAETDEHPLFVRDAADGFAHVMRERRLRALAVANAMLTASGQLVSVVYLLYLVDDLGFKPGVLGLIFSVGGLTSLTGAYLANRSRWFGGLGFALVISLWLRAAGMAFMPLAGAVSAVGVALLVANQLVTDPAWAFYDINSLSLRQTITPDRLLGRVNASMRTVELGAMLAGTAAGGVLGQTLGVRATLFIAVAGTLAASVVLAMSPVAHLKAMPAPEIDEPLAARELAVEGDL